MKKVLAISCAMLIVAANAMATGIFVKPGYGDRNPVCQRIAKRVSSFPDNCSHAALFSSPDLTELNWEPVNPLDHIDLLTRIRHYRSSPITYSQHPLSVKQLLEEREFTLSEIKRFKITVSIWKTNPIAYFDPDQKAMADGREETLMRVDFNGNPSHCGKVSPLPPYQSAIFFVNPDLSDLDFNVDPAAASQFQLARLFRSGKYLVLVDPSNISALPADADSGAPNCQFQKR